MILKGKITKDGNDWLIELPSLDLMTQGRTKKEAFEMIKDAVESLVNQQSFEIIILPSKGEEFFVESSNVKELVALMLKRQRAANKVTIQEVVDRMGVKSKNAYAQYERGTIEPKISTITSLLKAINPKSSPEFVFNI